jgi:hypothetical protein
MNQDYGLCSAWCVWLNYQVPDQISKEDYNKSIKKVNTITTYNDLVYFWQESPFTDPHYFLVYEAHPHQNTWPEYPFPHLRFQIDDSTHNINAINYFREGINPTWEDPNNQHGGRLVFQIDKAIENYKEIYEWLIFYFLGESESCAEDINGIRFISNRHNNMFKYHYRVEVWTKFNSKDEDKVVSFRGTFVKDFFTSFFVNNPKFQEDFKPMFKNNEEKEVKVDEEKK